MEGRIGLGLPCTQHIYSLLINRPLPWISLSWRESVLWCIYDQPVVFSILQHCSQSGGCSHSWVCEVSPAINQSHWTMNLSVLLIDAYSCLFLWQILLIETSTESLTSGESDRSTHKISSMATLYHLILM
jgi:hypothetical protein